MCPRAYKNHNDPSSQLNHTQKLGGRRRNVSMGEWNNLRDLFPVKGSPGRHSTQQSWIETQWLMDSFLFFILFFYPLPPLFPIIWNANYNNDFVIVHHLVNWSTDSKVWLACWLIGCRYPVYAAMLFLSYTEIFIHSTNISFAFCAHTARFWVVSDVTFKAKSAAENNRDRKVFTSSSSNALAV